MTDVIQPESTEPTPEPAPIEPAPTSHPAPSPTVQPETAQKAPRNINPKHHLLRFKNWYKTNHKISLPITGVVALIIIAGIVPWTRYKVAGLVIKHNLTVQVSDSVAGTPVSGATVSAGGASALTNGSGKATIHIKVGTQKVLIAKKYYTSTSASLFVPLLSQKTTPDVQLVATGRQVKITVTNLINKARVANIDIKVADIVAKTDSSGNALIVLPAGKTTYAATLSASGYNNVTQNITVNDKTIQQNDLTITPAGKVYFLSKLSGTVDVVKTNLDGTDRQTVLAGTGNESDSGTVLLASRDWKYLALLSIRDTSGNAQLNLIDTTNNDQLTNIDKGDATFTPAGWLGDDFVYQVDRNNVATGDSGAEAIKSFNATNQHLITIDQTINAGKPIDSNNFATTNFSSIYLLNDNEVVYAQNWSAQGSNQGAEWLANKNVTLTSADPTTGAKTDIHDFPVPASQDRAYGYNYYYIYLTSAEAQTIAIQVSGDNNTNTYYEYANHKFQTSTDINDSNFYQPYPTYLLSPSGNQTFWSEPRDGKHTIYR